MDLLGFDLNLADMDERFPILVQYGIYNRDLMPYKSDDFNQLIFVMGGRSSHQRRVRTSSQKACWMRFIRVHMSNRRRSILPMN